jgi:hypothetical protein
MNQIEKFQTWCNIYNITFNKDYECPYEGDFYPYAATMNAYPYGKMWAFINENGETWLNLCKEEEGWNAFQVPENWDPSSPEYIPQWRNN